MKFPRSGRQEAQHPSHGHRMSRFFSVSSTITANCLFTLALSIFILGQCEDTEIAIHTSLVRLTIDIDGSGLSFTPRASAGPVFSIKSRPSDVNHWHKLFDSITPYSWQNSAFAYYGGAYLVSPPQSFARRNYTFVGERYGVRHWCICLLSGGLFGLVHRKHLLMLCSNVSMIRRRLHHE